MAKNPVTILYDADGHPVSVVQDGSVYRLASVGKLLDADGNVITPAKDGSVTSLGTTLTAIKDTDGVKKIADPLPAGTNTLGKIDQGAAGATAWKTDGSGVTQPVSATSLPLPAGAATETTLAAIKNTDGVKKIVDPLPAGTNTLGKVDQGAAGATAWKTDGSGVTQPISAASLPLPAGAATETTLGNIKSKTDNIPSDPAKESGKLTTIDATLTAIKSTDGVKKIVDPLPAGTNILGAIRAGVDEASTLHVLKCDPQGKLITTGDSYTITGFGETRVASPWLVGNLRNKYELDLQAYSTEVSGGGSVAHVPAQGALRMSVGSASGDKARLRTNMYYRYQAGRSMLIRVTGYCSDTGQTNQVRRWGLFDDDNGLFFEQSEGTLHVVRRTSTGGSPVDTKIARADWNKDKMDGSGPSGWNIDVTKGNIWEITFQWLGVGVVTFFINGSVCHQMMNPNMYAAPYMQTAVLPMSWEVQNTGASAAGSHTYICASVSVEGGQEIPEYTFGAYTASDITVQATEIPLLSIRPKSTYNSIANRMVLMPLLAIISNDGGRVSYRFILNPALTGPSWVSADSSSGAEYDITATAFTGGTTLLRGLLPNSIDSVVLTFEKIFNSFARCLKRSAFGSGLDILTVVGKNEKTTGGSSTMRASMTWQEVR